MKIRFSLFFVWMLFLTSCTRCDISKVNIIKEELFGTEFKTVLLSNSGTSRYSGMLFDKDLILLVNDGGINTVLVMDGKNIRAIIPNYPSSEKHYYDKGQNEISWDEYISHDPNALDNYMYIREKYLTIDHQFPENEIPQINAYQHIETNTLY